MRCRSIRRWSLNADLLVHDATFLEEPDRREPIHATTEEALDVAKARQREDARAVSPVDPLRPRHRAPGAARAGGRQRIRRATAGCSTKRTS